MGINTDRELITDKTDETEREYLKQVIKAAPFKMLEKVLEVFRTEGIIRQTTVEQRFSVMNKSIAATEQDFSALEQSLAALEQSTAVAEQGFAAAEQSFTAAEQGLSVLEQGFAATEKDLAEQSDIIHHIPEQRLKTQNIRQQEEVIKDRIQPLITRKLKSVLHQDILQKNSLLQERLLGEEFEPESAGQEALRDKA
jgi:septal ring factor EnvC (AmiA/AmiB activator)